jgi:hypothetical protein
VGDARLAACDWLVGTPSQASHAAYEVKLTNSTRGPPNPVFLGLSLCPACLNHSQLSSIM